ncbi:MAG: Sec-independent protein translocase protein TatB [Bacillota bacterium]
MFNNLGFSEILLIAIVALVIFGPNKLPEMGRSVGQAIREFKKATQTITQEVAKAATEEVAQSAAGERPGSSQGTEATDKKA